MPRLSPDSRLIIAPHEPTAGHLEPIERWAARERLQFHRLAEATAESEVVLVDRVGVLGDLYALADIAFVGGGFHDAGLHSVLEPAAFGAPVLFGPQHGASRDAGVLIDRGGARSANDLPSLLNSLTQWSTDRAARAASGEHALATVRDGLGAAARSLAVVESLLGLPNDERR